MTTLMAVLMTWLIASVLVSAFLGWCIRLGTSPSESNVSVEPLRRAPVHDSERRRSSSTSCMSRSVERTSVDTPRSRRQPVTEGDGFPRGIKAAANRRVNVSRGHLRCVVALTPTGRRAAAARGDRCRRGGVALDLPEAQPGRPAARLNSSCRGRWGTHRRIPS
jgi:hypothetical protein